MTAIAYVGPDDLASMQIRGDVSHKGHSGGKVLVIGGGGPYAGPPALSGLAALRTGADLVHVAAPRRVAGIIAALSPDLVVWPLSDGDVLVEEDVARLKPLIEANEVVVVGMGVEISPRTAAAIRKIVPLCKKVVMDAGALMPDYPLKGIVTPHHNEFKRISGMAPTDDPEENAAMAKAFSAKMGLVTIVKGPTDVISDGSRVAFSRSGNPGMTVTGTGDVLAGIVGSLYCRNPAFEAACCGAFLNGLAGTMAFEEKGFGMLASEVAEMIPYALKKHHPAYANQTKLNSRF
jgi:ADP-dependent NAD(P)H-hydrate dehydratase / NAD(P)H-hydrate epimerase